MSSLSQKSLPYDSEDIKCKPSKTADAIFFNLVTVDCKLDSEINIKYAY